MKYLLVAILMLACGCKTKENIHSPETLPIGCHRNGDKYIFDNLHYADDPSFGVSFVSCANAKWNWLHLPLEDHQPPPNGTPDPETGMLP